MPEFTNKEAKLSRRCKVYGDAGLACAEFANPFTQEEPSSFFVVFQLHTDLEIETFPSFGEAAVFMRTVAPLTDWQQTEPAFFRQDGLPEKIQK